MTTDTEDEFWSNRFHACALAAGFIAAAEGRLGDSRYVQGLAYGLYEARAGKPTEPEANRGSCE